MNMYSLHPHALPPHEGAAALRGRITRVALTPFHTAGGSSQPLLQRAEIPSPPASQPPPPEVPPPSPPRPDVQPPDITDPPPSDVPLPVREPPGMPPPLAAAA